MDATTVSTVYTPSAIIDVFNNTFNLDCEKRVITVAGIYKKGTDSLYAGQFYDQLHDEHNAGQRITLKVTAIQRVDLQENILETVSGVLNRKIRQDSTIAFLLCLKK